MSRSDANGQQNMLRTLRWNQEGSGLVDDPSLTSRELVVLPGTETLDLSNMAEDQRLFPPLASLAVKIFGAK